MYKRLYSVYVYVSETVHHMSDSQLKDGSKAAKKNKKRKNKKLEHQEAAKERETVDFNYMLTKLKKQLEEAKSTKDHKRAGDLRNKIWVLTDLVAGVRTDIPEDELDEIISSIHTEFNSDVTASASSANADDDKSTVCTAAVEDRRLRNLRKKLDQIEVLKERQQRGETLEANQMVKLSGEQQVRDEINELQQTLTAVLLSH